MFTTPRLYRLDGTIPVPEPNVLAWADWFGTADRRVAFTDLSPEVSVSTVFLGLDHQWGEGPVLLFETMVFRRGLQWEEMARYATYKEAEAGHQCIVEHLRQRLGIDENA